MSNGVNWRRGKTSSYPPFASTSSGVRAVRCFVTPVNNALTEELSDHRTSGLSSPTPCVRRLRHPGY